MRATGTAKAARKSAVGFIVDEDGVVRVGLGRCVRLWVGLEVEGCVVEVGEWKENIVVRLRSRF